VPELESFEGTVEGIPVRSTAPVERQIERALLETRSAAFALLRLGELAHPQIGWRCTKLGEAMVAALQDTFGKDIT